MNKLMTACLVTGLILALMPAANGANMLSAGEDFGSIATDGWGFNWVHPGHGNCWCCYNTPGWSTYNDGGDTVLKENNGGPVQQVTPDNDGTGAVPLSQGNVLNLTFDYNGNLRVRVIETNWDGWKSLAVVPDGHCLLDENLSSGSWTGFEANCAPSDGGYDHIALYINEASNGAMVDSFVMTNLGGTGGGPNQPPNISNATLTPASISSVGTTQDYSADFSDPDGVITNVVWEFGDGERAFRETGSRTVNVTGGEDYVATVRAVDDDGDTNSVTVTWSSSDSGYPSLTVNSTPDETNSTTLTITGTSGGASLVQVSTDPGYGHGVLIDAVGTSNWTADVPLAPGYNRIIVQAQDSDGDITPVERVVRYNPAGPLGISNVTTNAGSVEKWDAIEITFDVDNSAATHPQFPYEPNDANLERGLDWVDGLTVNGVFWLQSDPSTTYTRPGFIYQDYQRQSKSGQEWLYPQGEPNWKVRFAPPATGNWEFRIEAAEPKGSAQSTPHSFTATSVTDPDNHGPVRVSQSDNRYFEYADGTYFKGTGHGGGLSSIDEAETFLHDIGHGANQHFFRWWISGQLWSAPWQSWTSRTLNYQGNTPAAGLGVDSAYGDGLAATWLSEYGSPSNPIMFDFVANRDVSLVYGETYTVQVRWRCENVTGPKNPSYPYGLSLKFTGWPTVGQMPGSGTVIVDHINGNKPWHVAEGTFVANGNFITDFITLSMENTTGGIGYVDEVTIREVLPDGSLGRNLVQDPEFNSYMVFDPLDAFRKDKICEKSENDNVCYRWVVQDKDDQLMDKYGEDGLPDPSARSIYDTEGSPSFGLHKYYFRYLIARYSAFRSIHSYEFVNEEAPGHQDMYRITNKLGEMAENDGNPHMAGTSVWAGFDEDEYKDEVNFPYLSHGDFHAYISETGWITPKNDLAQDTARAFREYDANIDARNMHKPVIWAEVGVGSPYEAQLSNDTDGTWLHKLTWARCNPGGLYALYWYTDNIWNHNLHHIYGAWNKFMDDIPLTNGNYSNAEASSSNSNIEAVGQKDLNADRAFLWINNKTNTWKQGGSSQSATINVTMASANTSYDVDWYNTSTGEISSSTSIQSNSSKIVSLSISSLTKDTAVKINKPGSIGEPEPTNLSPLDGATSVSVTATLTWTPGIYSTSHNVYLSTDEQKVVDLDNIVMTNAAIPSFKPELTLNETYYWCVEAVNDGLPNTVSPVQSFTVKSYIVVDDFEKYGSTEDLDNLPDRWGDYDQNGSSCYMYLETSNTHSGNNAIELEYINIYEGYPCARIGKVFDNARDWSSSNGGIEALSMYYAGLSDNDASDMWVLIEDAGGTSDFVLLDGPEVTKQEQWTQLNFALSDFSGVDLSEVKKLQIGAGDGPLAGPNMSRGEIYIDDIRLHPRRCVPSLVPADLTGDCRVTNEDLGILADDWLTSDPLSSPADLTGDNEVELADLAKLAEHWLQTILFP